MAKTPRLPRPNMPPLPPQAKPLSVASADDAIVAKHLTGSRDSAIRTNAQKSLQTRTPVRSLRGRR